MSSLNLRIINLCCKFSKHLSFSFFKNTYFIVISTFPQKDFPSDNRAPWLVLSCQTFWELFHILWGLCWVHLVWSKNDHILSFVWKNLWWNSFFQQEFQLIQCSSVGYITFYDISFWHISTHDNNGVDHFQSFAIFCNLEMSPGGDNNFQLNLVWKQNDHILSLVWIYEHVCILTLEIW